MSFAVTHQSYHWLPTLVVSKTFADRTTAAFPQNESLLFLLWAPLHLQFHHSHPPKSTILSPDSMYSWPHDTGRQKTESAIDKTDEPYTAEPEARCQSLRAELVSATYFVYRRGYHDTKYYKTSCSCTKTNTFVEILHFKQWLIQIENCRQCVRTDGNKDFDSIHCL